METPKILTVALIAALFLGVSSVSAYYLYVLPKQNTERLQFEQQKWSQEQQEKQSQEQQKSDQAAKELQLKKDQQVQVVSQQNEIKAGRDKCLQEAQKVYQTAQDGMKLMLSEECSKYIPGSDLARYCAYSAVDGMTESKTELEAAKDKCYKRFPIN